MPSIGKMNIGKSSMGGRKSSKESGGEFWKRFQGAVNKNYTRSEAAAIAGKETQAQYDHHVKRFAKNLKARTRKRG